MKGGAAWSAASMGGAILLSFGVELPYFRSFRCWLGGRRVREHGERRRGERTGRGGRRGREGGGVRGLCERTGRENGERERGEVRQREGENGEGARENEREREEERGRVLV